LGAEKTKRLKKNHNFHFIKGSLVFSQKYFLLGLGRIRLLFNTHQFLLLKKFRHTFLLFLTYSFIYTITNLFSVKSKNKIKLALNINIHMTNSFPQYSFTYFQIKSQCNDQNIFRHMYVSSSVNQTFLI